MPATRGELDQPADAAEVKAAQEFSVKSESGSSDTPKGGTSGSDGEEGTEALAGFSKIVFSTTLKEPLSWPNTQLVNRDPIEAVSELKETGNVTQSSGPGVFDEMTTLLGVKDALMLGEKYEH